jgi:hypothetical protein
MFWSRFDGSTWSEPELLIQRDESCILEDMMVLENGALLLLWEERLVHQAKDGDRTISGSGCHVIYRAYISSDEFLIERTIEPENPLFCISDGYSFVDDGHYIWCVFRYGSYGELSKIYRSGSEDGRVWSPCNPPRIDTTTPPLCRFRDLCIVEELSKEITPVVPFFIFTCCKSCHKKTSNSPKPDSKWYSYNGY